MNQPQASINKRKKIIVGAVVILTLGGVLFWPDVVRVLFFLQLFDEDKIVQNFSHFNQVTPHKIVTKASTPYPLKNGVHVSLPEVFKFDGEYVETQDFLRYINTTGLLILKDDKVVFEQYYRGENADTRHIVFSMSKSVISALIGIAYHEGAVKSLQDTVDSYVPLLVGSGYQGVTIKDVLQMSSGVAFDEDYGDFHSDINRFGRHLALGMSFDQFTASLTRERAPGTYNHYVSIDTQVLGMVLREATGQAVSSYMAQKLWHKIGAEADAYWITDDHGMEMALGGLNTTLRDMARFGRLYLHKGNWNGEQIIPAQWVADSTTPDAPHLQPGDRPELSNTPFGYGYQWWLPQKADGGAGGNADGEYMAIGIYNQHMYISPRESLVIVRFAANPHYISDNYISEYQSVAFFRAVAAHLNNK